jgi:hypothetical protein
MLNHSSVQHQFNNRHEGLSVEKKKLRHTRHGKQKYEDTTQTLIT